MRGRISPAGLILSLCLAATSATASSTPEPLSALSLNHVFTTSLGRPWQFSGKNIERSIRHEAPTGKWWDLRTQHSLKLQALRQKAGQSIARVRWLVHSRVAGLYCADAPAVVPATRGSLIAAIFSGESNLVPVGHQRPWDELAASEVTAFELRAECYFAPSAAEEVISLELSDLMLEPRTDEKDMPAVVLDAALRLAPGGVRARGVLTFRINPLPEDPCEISGEGDVRVQLPSGRQALAFLDQEYVSISDGSSVRRVPYGLPFFKAYLSEIPSSGALVISSGQRRWKLPVNAIPVLSAPDDAESALEEGRWAPPLSLPHRGSNPFCASAPPAWALKARGDWQPVPSDPLKAARQLWRPVPFWNANWGGFAGLSRPNAELAARMDGMLARAARAGECQPLIILDGGIFERQDTFNWDHHPLAERLSGPGELLRTREGMSFCLRWMRYCIARWGCSAAVSSLCLTMQLNTPGVAEFHTHIAAALRDWIGDSRLEVLSLHPLTRSPQVAVRLSSFESDDVRTLSSWLPDSRTAPSSGKYCKNSGSDGGACYELVARNPASTVASLTGTYMFGTPASLVGADALLFDVWLPPHAPADLRVGVHLCDRHGRWYQTLLPGMLRPGDWSTLALDLSAANSHALQPLKHDGAWNDSLRQGLTEIGLHVFSTHPNWRPAKNQPVAPLTVRFDHIRGVRFKELDSSNVQPPELTEREPEEINVLGSFEGNLQRGAYAWNVDPRLGACGGGRVASHEGGCFEVRAREGNPGAVALVGISSSEFSDWRNGAVDNCFAAEALAFDVWVPPQSPPDLRVGVHLRDRDSVWFETLLPGVCHPGEWTTFAVDLTAENYHGLRCLNPERSWTEYSRQRLSEIGLHVYSTHGNPAGSGGAAPPLSARFDNIRTIKLRRPGAATPPVITAYVPDDVPVPDSVHRGDLWEYHVQLNKAFANPFDARECDLMGIISTPSGKEVRVPMFFNQHCRRREATPGGDEIVEAVGAEFFTLRYRVTESGEHRVRIELREGGSYAAIARGEGRKVQFTPGAATTALHLKAPAFKARPDPRPSAHPFRGFLRVAPDQRHFQYDDGSFYYALGPCLRSPSDSRIPYRDDTKWTEREIDRISKRGTYQYDDYFAEFEKAGMNWARVWMCAWWGALEWRRDWPGYQGFGRYNLLNAWRIDHLLAQAEARGIALNLCLTNHGQFSLRIDKEWENNPYNARLGGPLVAARELFTSADGQIAHQNKLRYIVARYSHSPAILAWALFSELEFVDEFEGRKGYTGNIDQWHTDMASYLKSVDPNRHLVATHYSHPNRGESTLALPQIDIATSNAYSAFEELAHGGMDASAALADFWGGNDKLRGFKIFSKPSLVEEQGRHWMGVENGKNHNTREQLDADLHASLWGSLVQPLGGATGYWWWLHLHFDDRYSEFKALAAFIKDEDFRPQPGESDFEPVYRTLQGAPNLRGRALKSDRRLYAWIYHAQMPLAGATPDVAGGKMRVANLQAGKYRAEIWDTYKGTLIDTRQYQILEGASLEIQLPSVRRDLALKLKPAK